jgi:hypothetical protein
MENLRSTQKHLYSTRSDIENHFANITLNNTVDEPELFKKETENSPFANYNPFSDTYQLKVNSGRMGDITSNNAYPQFELFQENHRGPESDFYDSLQGIMENSITAKVYFSNKNIENLQRKIINGVFNRSEGKINVGRQSDTELKIVMRSIFLQNGRNVDCNIQEQVMQLNNKVLEYCVENVLIGAVGHINYIRDIQKTMDTMPNPENANIKGVNSLEPNIFF